MTLSEIMSIVDNAQSLKELVTEHHLKSVKNFGSLSIGKDEEIFEN